VELSDFSLVDKGILALLGLKLSLVARGDAFPVGERLPLATWRRGSAGTLGVPLETRALVGHPVRGSKSPA
jgi:hypothetical protein